LALLDAKVKANIDKQVRQVKKKWQDSGLCDYDYVLLLPQNDLRLNVLLRSAFIHKLGDRRGIVIEGAQAEELLTLYSFYAFTNKLIVGSFDLPHGRKLRNLLDSGIATEEELINDVILGAL
jgi:hypothetical protein